LKAHVLISAGSNLGDRLANLRQGVGMLLSQGTLTGVVCSSVYETPPWGFEADLPFYNICFYGPTELTPTAFMRRLMETEEEMGRTRTGGEGYASRTLDLDIVLWDRLIITSPTLHIPHPRAHLRRFVLQPAAEIAGRWLHPMFNADINTLLEKCEDRSEVKKVFPPLVW